jgi:DNA transformation protein and related proteins
VAIGDSLRQTIGMKISDMKGLGPKSSERLAAVGIETSEQLEELGAVGTYRLLQDAFPDWVSLNMLWGMQAALMEIDWRQLPEELKDQLLTDLES